MLSFSRRPFEVERDDLSRGVISAQAVDTRRRNGRPPMLWQRRPAEAEAAFLTRVRAEADAAGYDRFTVAWMETPGKDFQPRVAALCCGLGMIAGE